MKRTATQNAQLHVLITQLGIDKEIKAELVDQFTTGRTQSSSEMEYRECESLIGYLKSLQSDKKIDRMVYAHSERADRMRKKILSMCHELGWEITPGGKIDWYRLNGWLLKYGYLKKELNSYTYEELPALVTQFEQLLKSHYGKATR